MASENSIALTEALDAYWDTRRKDMEGLVDQTITAAYRTFEHERGRRPIKTILAKGFMQLLQREGLV